MSYGQYKKAATKPVATKIEPPKPMTPSQRAHAERMKALWHDYFPGDPFLKSLHALGMIDGYRNIISITPKEAPHAPIV